MFKKYFVWSIPLVACLASVSVGTWAARATTTNSSLGILVIVAMIAFVLFLRMTVLGFAISETDRRERQRLSETYKPIRA